MSASEFEPRIIAFLCNWCTYTGADLAGTSRIQYCLLYTSDAADELRSV